jgi:hypothetical protein
MQGGLIVGILAVLIYDGLSALDQAVASRVRQPAYG